MKVSLFFDFLRDSRAKSIFLVIALAFFWIAMVYWVLSIHTSYLVNGQNAIKFIMEKSKSVKRAQNGPDSWDMFPNFCFSVIHQNPPINRRVPFLSGSSAPFDRRWARTAKSHCPLGNVSNNDTRSTRKCERSRSWARESWFNNGIIIIFNKNNKI